MNKLHAAKTMLNTNQRLVQHYNKMVTLYLNDTIHGKSDKSNVIVKIMNETKDLEITAAVCALAKIESNKRHKKKD